MSIHEHVAVTGRLLAALLLATAAASAATIRFPDDRSVIDARRDFGARGDGVTDDTAALQRAVEASSGTGGNTRVLFIPHGTYRVSRTLVVRSGIGPWIYGESRDGVVIRMADGIADTNVTAVIRTHPSDTDAGSADWFMRNIRNLTIDAGDNPGIDGIRWFGNNSSALKEVTIRGNGPVGVNSGFLGQNGPNLVQDVRVEGFETGVRSTWIWGQTLSRVTIRNARKEGVYVTANALAIEDLATENVPVALRNDYPNDWTWWGGVVALVGGRFTGGDPARAAITNTSLLYARDVVSEGFRRVLASTTPSGGSTAATLAEYTSHPATRLHSDSPARALRLPIRREPDVPWENDTNRWVCANEYGARSGDNIDDTAAIQRAVDAAAAAGATTVYLRGIGGPDPNWYNLGGAVRLRAPVRHLIGLGFGRILRGANGGSFVVDDASAPVVKLQNLQAFGGGTVWAENRSTSNVLVLEGCDLRVVGAGGGDIFATDCPSTVEMRSPGQSLWARQLNPEGGDPLGLVRNHGGNVWALGVKNEGRGMRFLTDNGGRTEVFGMFNYGPGVPADHPVPVFEVDNAALSVMGLREIVFGGNDFPIKMREIRGGAVRDLRGGGWIGWPMYAGWVPSLTNGPVAAARPRLTPERAAFLEATNLTATTTTPGAVLRFTRDGSEPTAASEPWPATLVLTNSATMRLRAFHTNLAPSATTTGVFSRLLLRDPVPGIAPAEGVTYAYYEGSYSRVPDFAGLQPRRTGVVPGFDTSPRLRDANHAFRFTGHFTAPADGIYVFSTASDDGSRLWIGDDLVVDNDGLHGVEERQGTVALRAGRHPIAVGYFNAAGGGSLVVSFEGPGLPRQPVPARLLAGFVGRDISRARRPGVAYRYYEGSWPVLPDFDALSAARTGTVASISLSPRLRSDNFGMRFHGWIDVPADGPWEFFTSSDDGSRLRISGVEVVDNDGVHAPRERSGTIMLGAGSHPFVLDYFDGTGGDALSVAYRGPGLPRTTLPASALSNTPGGMIGWGVSSNRLWLSWVRSISGPAPEFSAASADDLLHWNTMPAEVIQVPPYEVARASRPLGGGDAGFLRLSRTQP